MNYLDHESVKKVVDKAYATSVEKKRRDTEKRAITIVKDDKTVCTVCIQLMEFAPLLQSPTKVIETKKFLEPKVDQEAFKDYQFTEYLPTYSNDVDNNFVPFDNVYKNASTEDVANMKKYIEDTLDNKPRYYTIGTIANPLTNTTYTFFVDRLHKDIFYVSGLDLFINDDVLPDPTSSIVITGTKVGGMPQMTTPGLEDNLTVYNRLSNKYNNFFIPKIPDDATSLKDKLKVYAVTFTGDLPGNTKGGNYPVFYDRLEHINGREIQIARQDTIPFLWVEVGTFKDLNSGEDGTVPNFLPYNYKGNSYRLKYNGSHYNPNAKLAVIIPIW